MGWARMCSHLPVGFCTRKPASLTVPSAAPWQLQGFCCLCSSSSTCMKQSLPGCMALASLRDALPSIRGLLTVPKEDQQSPSLHHHDGKRQNWEVLSPDSWEDTCRWWHFGLLDIWVWREKSCWLHLYHAGWLHCQEWTELLISVACSLALWSGKYVCFIQVPTNFSSSKVAFRQGLRCSNHLAILSYTHALSKILSFAMKQGKTAPQRLTHKKWTCI